MNRRSYRIPCLVAQALLGLTLAASTSSAQLILNPDQDHFWCYIVSSETPQPAVDATLHDQFQTASVKVGTPLQFCNPVQKKVGSVTTGIVDIRDHITVYHLETAAPLPTERTFFATNQFGTRQQLTVDKATTLMVPTKKNNLAFPTGLDHFLCYPVTGDSINKTVQLSDQFQTQEVMVEAPTLFCNPVQKTRGTNITRIQHPLAHQLCYEIRFGQETEPTRVKITNQIEPPPAGQTFGDIFTLTNTQMLCVPSTKQLE